MVQLVLAAMILVSLYLGVRTFLKLREISKWEPEADGANVKGKPLASKDLLELKIDEPPDMLDARGLPDEKHLPRREPTSKDSRT